MSNLEPGTVVELQVEREAPFGYFLSNGEEDVLLHRSEVPKDFNPDIPQTVFLYQDHEGRIAATLTVPSIRKDHYDWAPVAGVQESLGVFIDIGLSKDILVSKDDLPEITHLWPKRGDRLYCSLKTDRKGRIFGKLGGEEVMRKLAVPANRKVYNSEVKGHVYKLLKVGSFLISEEGYMGFIHESQRKDEPRLGQLVEGRVIDVKPDGTINVSLLPRSYEVMDKDAEMILLYLEKRGGQMPYWDKSMPDEIQARFGLSKAAFKRALGKLMKTGRIYQEDGWTHLKK